MALTLHLKENMHVLTLPQEMPARWSPGGFLRQASLAHSEWKLWFRVNRAHVGERRPLLRVSQTNPNCMFQKKVTSVVTLIVFSGSENVPCNSPGEKKK